MGCNINKLTLKNFVSKGHKCFSCFCSSRQNAYQGFVLRNFALRTRLLAFIGVMLMLSLLSGCSHTPQTQRLLADKSALEQAFNIPIAHELVDVPFFPQTEFQCGPASLATLYQYQGLDIVPDDLVSQVYVPEKQGSLQIEMVASVRRNGLVPYVIEGDLRALLQEVSAGHPVLILQNLAFNWYPQWHYAVVVGYDLDTQTLVMRSGETERWQTPLEVFERTWARGNHWAMVVVPPTRLAQTAEPFLWLRTAYDLERVGQVDSAKQAYLTGHQAWPDRVESGMALANLYYQQERYQQSAQVLQDLTERQPHNAMLWNNLAYPLQALGCHQQALNAALCALDQDANFKSAQATLRTMQALDLSVTAESCPKIRCP